MSVNKHQVRLRIQYLNKHSFVPKPEIALNVIFEKVFPKHVVHAAYHLISAFTQPRELECQQGATQESILQLFNSTDEPLSYRELFRNQMKPTYFIEYGPLRFTKEQENQ